MTVIARERQARLIVSVVLVIVYLLGRHDGQAHTMDQLHRTFLEGFRDGARSGRP